MLITMDSAVRRGKSPTFGSGNRTIIRPRRKLSARSTALVLQQLTDQLPVAQAIGGEAQRQAQYYATVNTLLAQGKSELDATALAAAQLRNAQAASVSNAQQSTQALQEQNALQQAGYVSTVGMSQVEAARAQQQALSQQAQLSAQQTYNKVLRDTGDEQTAYNAAIAKGESYQTSLAQAADRVKQAQQAAHQAALAWQADMLGISEKAQQMAAASQQAADAFERAARAAQGASLGAGGDFGSFDVPKGTQYTSTYGYGGLLGMGIVMGAPQTSQNMTPDQALAAAKSGTTTGTGSYVPGFGWVGGTAPASTGPDYSQVSSIYDLKNSQTNDKSVQKANLNEEMAWLQTLPETVARDQSIVNLQKSIDTLNSSTSNLNSTMQDALSPYYSQDPRTSHIGFRSQGMSTGGEFTVPGGISTNDNMIGQIPLASGEIVSVRRPGDSSGSSQTFNINVPITIGAGANKDQIGRTVYQAMQGAARQLAASQK